MKNGHHKFYEIMDELSDLHDRKNADYAGDDPLSNLRGCENMGVSAFVGTVIRLSDKFSRLQNFVRKGELKVSDEKITDTLNDIAVYAILARILVEEEYEKSKVQ